MTSERARALQFCPPAEVDAMDTLRGAFEAHGWTVDIAYGSGGMMGVNLTLDGMYADDVDTHAVYHLAHGYSGTWGLCRYANMDDLGYDRSQWCDNDVAHIANHMTAAGLGLPALVDRVDEVIAAQEARR